jgi:tRNA dimethylallyltransferase
MEKPKMIAVAGPTASGKSCLAVHLARRFKAEIISADSVQVYRGLDIGTAKPSLEQRRQVPHHLIDILDLGQNYSVALFRQQADKIIRELNQRRIPVIVVGGTGLYLKALTRGLFYGPSSDNGLRLLLHKRVEAEGSNHLHCQLQKLDAQAASKIHPRDIFRIIRAMEVYFQVRRPISEFQREHGFQERPYEVFKAGLTLPRDELYRRIESRTDEMIKMGWVEEVKSLLNDGHPPDLKPFQSLGYKYLVSFLLGKISLQEAIRIIKRDTRRYAKRQLTWFNADPEINWYPGNQETFAVIEKDVEEFYRRS